MSNMNTKYRSCPSHCCPIHGCKYGHSECPVETGLEFPEYPGNNGCEDCEMDAEDRASDPEWQTALLLLRTLVAEASDKTSTGVVNAVGFLAKHDTGE